ncbi:MAG: 23S rRNA (adenine(2030)-N(6))-methyltransferase RlmJ [Paracoccaceae bacterium]
MLSYQHIYHAGNLADVHKHALLAWVLAYLTQKDKPLSYIETHAGRGLYDLGSDEAAKTGEAAAGVARVEARFAPGHPYRQRLDEVRATWGPMAYPGSPLIAGLGLRQTDRLHLAELHPQEFRALGENLALWEPHLDQRDGFDFALSVTPPTPRRGLMLVDPSYEVKTDYDRIPPFLQAVARKWNVGVLMLWYPLLSAAPHAPMVRALAAIFPQGFCHELRFPPAREGHRMVGSGMFVVNPPYGIEVAAAEIARAIAP